MNASHWATGPSCLETSISGRAARGVNAAVLVYSALPGADAAARSAHASAAAQQACELQRALPRGWRIIAAVEGVLPVADALRAAQECSPRRLIVVSMDPWRADLLRTIPVSGLDDCTLEVRDDWGDETSLIDLHARAVREAAISRGLSPRNSRLVLGASGGCRDRVGRTARLIAARLGWPLANAESDEAEDPARMVHRLDLTPHPLSSLHPQKLLAVLNSLVRRGRHPMMEPPPQLFSWTGVGPQDATSARLIMVGICVRGALGPGDGPALRYCDADTFCALKRPHGEVLELLSSLRDGVYSEAFIWNTCNRLELYGWLKPEVDGAHARGEVAATARAFLGPAAGDANTLYGRRALQHLLRTAAGLNSALVGDAEIFDQLESARRTAEHAGMAGCRTQALLLEAAEVVREVRDETPWGGFAHRYCEVALDRLRPQLRSARTGRCVVIGGSTTGASVLETLAGPLGASPSNLALIYRGQRSGALTRRLHGAIAGGRIVNVEAYNDSAVMEEILQADAVFLTGDHREPVLRGPALAARRDTAAHPLLVVDFNTLGSTRDLDRIEGVRLITTERIEQQLESFNREVVSTRSFSAALGEAERCIGQHAGVEMPDGCTPLAGGNGRRLRSPRRHDEEVLA